MDFSIRAATETDMVKVAEVHKVCFPASFSTKLGIKILTEYYSEFYRECPHLFYVCENESGKMCGFVMGYILGKTTAVSSFTKKNKSKIALKTVGLLLRFEKTAWKKVKNTLSKPKKGTTVTDNSAKDGQGDLLSICVTDDMKGSGAAVKMVETYHDALKAGGHTACYLTCETDNPRGLAFYKKLGYVVAEETPNKICFRKDL